MINPPLAKKKARYGSLMGLVLTKAAIARQDLLSDRGYGIKSS